METAKRDFSFPKEARILRSSDFRKVYDEGSRVSGRYFAAFCLKKDGEDRARIGMTVPRSLGKSVVRNRLKRRLREAVRFSLGRLAPGWWIVLNPRRAALDALFEDLKAEVEKLFLQCRS